MCLSHDWGGRCMCGACVYVCVKIMEVLIIAGLK
jgi:hypothetical protein